MEEEWGPHNSRRQCPYSSNRLKINWFCLVKFLIKLMVWLFVQPQTKCTELSVTECIFWGSHVSPSTVWSYGTFPCNSRRAVKFLKATDNSICPWRHQSVNFLIPFIRGWFSPSFLDTFWTVIMSLHQLLSGWELIPILSHSTDSNETYRQACEPWRWEKRSPQLEPMVARWQNLVPSFPRIAPGWRAWGRNPRKGRDPILQRSVEEP